MTGPLYSPITESIYNRLPEVHRIEDGRQSNPDSLPPIAALRNLIPNPHGEVNLTGWTGGANATRTRVTSPVYVGTNAVLHSRNNTTAGNCFSGYTIPTEVGKTYTFVAIVYPLVNGITVVSGFGKPQIAVPLLNQWNIVTDTRAATTTNTSFFVSSDSAPNVVADHAVIGALMVVEGSVAPSYFDGDTKASDVRYGSLWSWEGTRHQSVSVQSAHAGDIGAYPLKRFISATGDQAGDVEAVYERFVNGELVDPEKANPEWLDYLAQHLGVGDVSKLTDDEKRKSLADPSVGYRAGSGPAIIAAAKTIVGGSGHVGLYKFTTDQSAIGGASQWDILLITRQGEAQGDVVARVIELGAKPAGVRLYHRVWTATWAGIHTAYPTWVQINAAPNWDAIHRTGI